MKRLEIATASIIVLAVGTIMGTMQDAAAERRAVSHIDLLSYARPSDVKLSPNGRWVAYALRTPDLERNSDETAIYLVPADGSRPPRKVWSAGPFLWSVSSDALLRTVNESGAIAIYRKPIVTDEDAAAVARISFEHALMSEVVLSPDGKRMALIAMEPRPAALPDTQTHAIHVSDPDWNSARTPMGRPQPKGRLWVIDLVAGNAQALTDVALNVADFSWSPDGRLMVAGSPLAPPRPRAGCAR